MSDYSLQVIEGPNSGKKYNLNKFPVIIGRKVKEGLSINDSKASQRHIRIQMLNHDLILENLDSTSDTYLNGSQVNELTKLSSGDTIQIGNTQLKLKNFCSELPKFSIESEIPVLSSSLGILINNNSSKQFCLSNHYNIDPNFNNYHPQYLRLSSHINDLNQSLKFGQMIFDYSGDFLVKEQLYDAFSTLVKLIGKNIIGLHRGAALTVRLEDKKLSVESIYSFTDHHHHPCLFHLAAIEDLITCKYPIFLNAQHHPHPLNLDRLLMPIICRDQVIVVLHLECEQKAKVMNQINQLSFCQALISRITPNIENLILRKSIESLQLGSIMALITAIEAKDTYTVGHSERVCRYSLAIADQLNIDRETKRLLMISSLCHDVGKIGTPDHILKNSSLLSHEEYTEIKHHPSIGDKIIKHLPFYQKIKGGIRHHHEKMDGTGYPDELEGDNIPLFGRIVAIADAFDAMISGRSYSGFLDAQAAMGKLIQEHDSYDINIINAFEKAYNLGTLTKKTGTKEYNIGKYYK